MTTNEMKLLIASNSIATIFLNNCNSSHVWYLFCSYKDNSRVAENYGFILQNNDGKGKSYTSLDRAYAAIKKMGYMGRIEIDNELRSNSLNIGDL